MSTPDAGQQYPNQWESSSSGITPPKPPGNGAAVWSLVLAILGLILCWFSVLGFVFGGTAWGFGLVPIILSLLGIILGVVGIRRASRQGASKRGVGIAGLVIGIIALIASVAITIASSLALAVIPGGLGDTVQQAQQCARQQAAQGTPPDQIQQICQQQIGQQLQRQIGGGQ